MKAFAQDRRQDSSATGGKQRGPRREAGEPTDRLAETLNRSPRVVAQAKLAEDLARRQPRQEVVQRTSKQEAFESKLQEEEEKPEIVPSIAPQSLILIEERPLEQLPEDQQAALKKVQEVYQGREARLGKDIQEIDGSLAQLPKFIYLIDEDGQILRSEGVHQLLEVRELLQKRARLKDSQKRIAKALELLPSLITAFQPTGVEATPEALKEKVRIERQAEALRKLRPFREQRLQVATEGVDRTSPPRKIEAYKEFMKDPVKPTAFADAKALREKAAEELKKHELEEIKLGREAKENQLAIDQANSILSGFDETLATTDDALNKARGTLNKFPAFLDKLTQQNLVLPRQQENQQRIAELIQILEQSIDTYLRFNGSPGEKIYRLYRELLSEATDFQEDLLRMPLDQILAEIEAINDSVSSLKQRRDKLGPLLPMRPELEALRQEKRKEMAAQYLEIQQALKAATEVGSKAQGSLASQLKRQGQLKKAAKALATTGEPGATMEALVRLQQEQAALDKEVAENPDLAAVVTTARLKKLQQKNPYYAELIEGLLQSGRVLDPNNLRGELARPVGPEKYVSREMELEFLLNAAVKKKALVQVGRMRKGELAAALLERGLTTTAESVAQATEAEFEADAILYLPDGTIEAVQHKTTTSKNPLEGRTHSSKEKTEPELQKQLQDAANQLSGLTAQGSVADAFGRIPETPPPGAKRIANLRFQNVSLPGHEALQKYNAIVKSVLGGVQRQAKGPRWQFVERVILNFRDGRVVYTGQGGGLYRGSFEPSGKSNVNPYDFELYTQ